MPQPANPLAPDPRPAPAAPRGSLGWLLPLPLLLVIGLAMLGWPTVAAISAAILVVVFIAVAWTRRDVTTEVFAIETTVAIPRRTDWRPASPPPPQPHEDPALIIEDARAKLSDDVEVAVSESPRQPT